VQLKKAAPRPSAIPLIPPAQEGILADDPFLSGEVSRGVGNQGNAAAVSQPTPPVIKHTVQKRQNSLSLSQRYQVEEADKVTLSVPVRHQQLSEADSVSVSNLAKPKALASSEEVGIVPSNNTQHAVIQAENVLKSHRVNRLVQKLKAGQIETTSKAYEVNTKIIPSPAQAAAQPLLDEPVTVNGEVDSAISAKQRVIINRLKQKSNHLQDSLSQLRFEEPNNSSVVVTEIAQPASKLAPLPTTNEVSVNPVVVEANEGQQNPALLSPSVVTSNGNAVLELQQSPNPEAAVEIPDGQDSEAQTPNAASVNPIVVGANKAQQNAALLSPSVVKSNGNAVLGLQQSPDSEVAVGIPDGQDFEAQTPNAAILAPQVMGNTEGQNVAEQAPAVVTSNEAAILEAQNVQHRPEAVVVVPDVQDAVNEPTVVGKPSLDYQVKAGDTLSAIARNYGISLSDLVKTNQLSNPDLLEINQQIKIPAFQYSSAVGQNITVINRPTQFQKTASTVPISRQERGLSNQPVFVVPPVSPSANNTSEIQTNTELIAYNPAGNLEQESLEVPPKPLAESSSLGAAYSGMGGSISDETDQLSTPAYDQTQLAETAAKPEPQSNLDVPDLRTDIQKLRQKYYAQPRGGQLVAMGNETSSVAAPVQIGDRGTAAIRSQVVHPQVRPKESANQPINAEFRVAQAAETLQPNPRKRISTQTSAAPRVTKARVATAPSSIEPSGSIQSFGVRQVSPELPPLGAVDTYLPKPNAAPLKGYIWPAKGVLTSGYGYRWGRMHKGIDVAAPIGTPIVAAAPGVVVRAGWNSGGYGKLVDIKHADGTLTRYAHNNRILVQAGQQVEQGQRISEMGSTGFSTGPHLHFELHPGGKGAVNPIALLPGR
jgi:murein DD-endopeptidase MepM/ murein hydrolase activator NlpD